MSASGKKVRAFSQSATQKARLQVSLLSIGSICRGGSRFSQHRETTVGAGLLAKAVYQATSMLTDTPTSRASPLPHFDRIPISGSDQTPR
ncbi:hypothetical protein ELQ88_04505 [Pseudomonas sp. MPC6]|nr:hypothetical protein ELQ88_04505 [Pseudomonas sp. MPC6]